MPPHVASMQRICAEPHSMGCPGARMERVAAAIEGLEQRLQKRLMLLDGCALMLGPFPPGAAVLYAECMHAGRAC